MKVAATLSKASAAKFNLPPTRVECEVNIPAKLTEMVKLFGEDVVTASATTGFVLDVQALERRMLFPKLDKAGKVVAPPSTPAQIQTAVTAWKPNVRNMVRQTAAEKVFSSLDKLTPEEKKALLARLTAK